MLGLVDEWRAFLQDGFEELHAKRMKRIEKHLLTWRPPGFEEFA